MINRIRQLFKLMGQMNLLLNVSALLLVAIGVAFVYSACSVREDSELQMLYMRHAESGVIGFIVLSLISLVDYRQLMRWGWAAYLCCLVLLVLVLLIGDTTMGARRWLFGMQPSEPAKLAIILFLSWLYGRRDARRGVGTFLVTLLIVAVPVALILKQPDLGTAMVMIPTVLVMLFVANVAPRLLWSCLAIGVIATGVLLGVIYAAENPELPAKKREALLAATHLREHQIKRLQVFLFPDKDIHGSGYNRRQSEIAVGSGGMWGKGYRKGEQYTLGYLPPSVSANDFIFAVLAEETGFAGSLTVLMLFLLVLWSGVWVALQCKDDMGRLYCTGVVTLLFSHMFINIAMMIGLMPITGLPLPFVSYGRTFLLTILTALGLIQSVSIYGRESDNTF